jgi:hypothetical protein
VNLRLTPDGGRYLSMGRGNREPLPFHLRWLLPWLCRHHTRRWLVASSLGYVGVVCLTAVLALQHGATQTQAIVAAALVAGLPALRFMCFAPVLVDMPGVALALAAAVLWPVEPLASIAVVFVAATVSEKAPILAAIFALSPILLVGLAAPLIRLLAFRRGAIDPRDALGWTLAHPFKAGRKGHAGKWRDPRLMLMPWGACLVVLAAAPSLWLVLALLAGYSQLLVATDTVRLYQTAAPVVCISAAVLIPEAWILPVLLAHWFNPFMGSGI